MSLIVLILIVGGTLLLVALPLLPSIRAWRDEIDSDALVIRDRYEEEEHRTAADLAVRIGLRQAEEMDALTRIEGDHRLEEGARIEDTLSVSGSFEAARHCTVCAVHAGEDLRLGEGATATGWLHAGRVARLSNEARVVGSVSAADRIELAEGVRFERLSAPVIQFGRDPEPVSEEAAFLVQEPTPVPENVRWIAWSKAIYDNFEVKDRTWLHGDLIVRGDLRVGRGAVIDGTVKVHGDVVVADEVRITGGLFSDGDVRLGRACRIDGVCSTGGDLDILTDTIIGTPERRVTVNAGRLTVSDGVRIHGVVVATETGTVVSPAPDTTGPADRPADTPEPVQG